ncbi:MAG: type II toxin-antitoxin system Phd/YefM family antitoxin [Cyanobium sp.]
MALVNVHQAKTHFSQLLQEVEQGKEVVIARSGVPIARLVAWQAPAQPVEAPGAMRGQIELAEDFDAPLDGLRRLRTPHPRQLAPAQGQQEGQQLHDHHAGARGQVGEP